MYITNMEQLDEIIVDIAHMVKIKGRGVKRFDLFDEIVEIDTAIDCAFLEGMTLREAITEYLSNYYEKIALESVDYVTKHEYLKKYTNSLEERPTAKEEDFIESLETLEKTWNYFKDDFFSVLTESEGIFNVRMIEESITRAKEKAKALPENEIAIEGFFDSFVALVVVKQIGVKTVYKMFDEEIDKLKKKAKNRN